MLAMRTDLPQGLTVGFAVCCALLPVWFPLLRLYRGATNFMILGLLAVAAGILLTQLARIDHSVSTSAMLAYSFLMLGLLFGVGLVLWARTLLSDAAVSVWFGIGLLAGISPSSAAFASNPWRFGFSVAVTVVALGLAQLSGKRWVELTALLVLAAASGLTDARSSFAILLLTALLVAWQMRSRSSTRRGSALKALLAVAAIGVVVFSVGQALILEGFLGQATQERSQAQISASGSLILGGRPELAATTSLMGSNPWGFGSGVHANLHDILIAKSGMISIGYQPDNGYVERYMFGDGFELHSVVGDLWANFGLVGVLFAAFFLFVLLRSLGTRLSQRTASAIFLYLGIKALWNLMFAPLYSSAPLMILLGGLIFVRSSSSGGSTRNAEFLDDSSAAREVVTEEPVLGRIDAQNPVGLSTNAARQTPKISAARRRTSKYPRGRRSS